MSGRPQSQAGRFAFDRGTEILSEVVRGKAAVEGLQRLETTTEEHDDGVSYVLIFPDGSGFLGRHRDEGLDWETID